MASTRSRPRGRENARSPAGGVATEHAAKIYGVATASLVVIVAFLAMTSTGHVIDAATQHFMLYYAGVFTLIALCASVVLGLIATDRMVLHPGHRIFVQSAHRAASFGAVAFLLIHITTEILAQRVHLLDSVVPFLSPFRTFYIGLGTIASDLIVLIVITGILRKRFTAHGKAWRWRAIHYTSYVAFVCGVWHGLLGGRPGKPYVDWSYGFVVAAVALGLAVRILANSLRPKETLSSPPVPESASSGSAPMRAASMFAQLGIVRAAAMSTSVLAQSRPQPMLSAPVDGWHAGQAAGMSPALAALPAAGATYQGAPYGYADDRQPYYEPGYEGPPRYMGAPRHADSGPMPRVSTGSFPQIASGPAQGRPGAASGPLPRATTGPLPRLPGGPGQVRDSGPMPRLPGDPGRVRDSGPMPRLPGGPGQGRDSGPMPRATTGPIPQAGNGPALGWGGGPRPGATSGPMPRVPSGHMPGATTGPLPRAATGPLPRAATGPMPQLPGGPGQVRDSGPMPRVPTGPIPQAGNGPAPGRGSGPMPQAPRSATGPVPRGATGRRPGAASGPMPRVPTGPMPAPGTGPMPSAGTGSMPTPGSGQRSRPGSAAPPGGRNARPGGAPPGGGQPGGGPSGRGRPDGRSAHGQAEPAGTRWAAPGGWAEPPGPHDWARSPEWAGAQDWTSEQDWMGSQGLTEGQGWQDGQDWTGEQGWTANAGGGAWYSGQPPWEGGAPVPDPSFRYREPGPGMPGYRGSRDRFQHGGGPR